MTEITREEIERAIAYYKENEFYMQKYNADVVTVRMNERALAATDPKGDAT